ncbi:CMGC/DYRK/DYRK2 protein kinase [Saprolegnia parasitica CBS 223.65]|uniref:CMGC/DYRK/DYRK2 protein kinase n=1 Tax=Saprolegnia parasitica (strain CBS 223.65) TaxID=695850 RepID=A0A067C1X9_SAPPC|nr:CMGC/DYRK/DYRK2 protein kinase [Saprolegnia parasitica CBS 223.65]KDO24764.1 CMGC/DYRK/DYRK2 protein kinase [Saprolegnia parasitica CBS 223.65]|eukprot:XP_012204441.1 CMGC/DYRK/DYRK2 protein kinase [Saprolegnia parasitica CBS 223.65]
MRAFGRPIELPSLRDRFHIGRAAQVVEKEPARSTSIPSLSTRERKEPSDPLPSNPRLQPTRPPDANSKPRESVKPKAPESIKPDSSSSSRHTKANVDGKAAKDDAPSKVAETSVATAVPRPPTEPRPPPKQQPLKDPPRGFDHNRGHNRGLESTPTIVQSPQAVLETASHELLDFEKTEILAFDKVHYYGTLASKTRANAVGNDGFDDENGDYVANVHDHLSYRYEIVGHLGRGSFGQVLKCHDRASRAMVAVKIVRNKQKFQEQSIVEAQLLSHMKQADSDGKSNIIRLHESFTFRNHLCMSFELLSLNLYEHLRLEQFRGLPVLLIKKMAVEMLHALSFLKTQHIVHCDLKPENILLKKPKSHLVALIDFGSSCFEHATFFTYIQSRFYRAPEVILGLPYGHPIDMWSFGCIIGELFTGYPIFPGENEAEQLACIMEVLDVPPSAMVATCKRRKNFFDDAGDPLQLVNSRGRKRRPKSRELRALLKNPDGKMVDFVARCLAWDPAVRLTPSEALAHEWLLDVKPKPASRTSMSKPKQKEGPESAKELAPVLPI